MAHRQDSLPLKDLLASSSATVSTSFWTKTKFRATIGLAVLALIGGGLAAIVASPYGLATAGTAEAATQWWEDLPHTIKEVATAERTILQDKNGKKFATLYQKNRVNVPLKRMGDAAPAALIATEDAQFFEHAGMDPKGIMRALVNNLFNDGVQGASTITQQLVQNLRQELAGDNEEAYREAQASTPRGKLEEVRYAQGLEQEHSKEEILEAYLNIVYFGAGAYGIEAAAQRYYSTKAKNLTVPQAATLIGVLKSPTAYNPIDNPRASRQRRNVVMKRMVETGYISEDQYLRYKKKKTPIKPSKPKNGCGASDYPYYCQLVIEQFLNASEFGKTPKARKTFWEAGGLTVRTPLDPEAMMSAQRAVDEALDRTNRVAAGLASIIPGKGHVAAIAQNRSWGSPTKEDPYGKTQLVYAATPAFQVGSTFKPITAAAALEEGLPASTRIDSANGVYFANLDEPSGGFKNDSRRGYGYINMTQAMKYSVNTYFVGLVDQVGVIDTAAMARRLGMKSVPNNLTGREGSLTLGAFESSPLELATVYATLGGRGVACEPVFMTSVQHRSSGEEVRAPDGNCHQEVSPAVADTVANILQAPFSEGGTASRLRLDRKAAGKTGTTDDAAATWFAGFTPQLATAVWVGDPRGGQSHPLYGTWAYGAYHANVFGGTIAGPIWRSHMSSYHSGLEKLWYPKPGGVSASMASRIVPNVQGVTLDSAITTLLASGFKVEILKKTAEELPHLDAPGYVARQSPKGGGKAAYGDTIKLSLTAGSKTNVRVPTTVEELEDATEARRSKKEKRGTDGS